MTSSRSIDSEPVLARLIRRGPSVGHHQPPASRMSRWRTRAATIRRYSAVERTSSIGLQLGGERLGRQVGGLRRRRPALEGGLRGASPDRRGGHGPERQPDVRPGRRRIAAVAPAEGDDDLADRLGAPRPDLAEAQLATGQQRDPDAQQQLVGRQGRPPVGRPELGGRDRPLAADGAQHERRIGGEQDRQRVTGRRGVGDVAAERPAVLDLGRADRRGRLDQHGEMLAAERRAPDLRVRRQGAEGDRVAVDRDPAQLIEPPQVEDRVRRLARAHRSARPSGRCRRRSAGPGPSASDRVGLGQRARAGDGRLDRHRASAPAGGGATVRARAGSARR